MELRGRARWPRQRGDHFSYINDHAGENGCRNFFFFFFQMGEGDTYRNETDAGFSAIFVHLPFFFSVQQVVVVLHADELCPSVFLRTGLHHGELIRPHAARTDLRHIKFPQRDYPGKVNNVVRKKNTHISHLPLFHKIMQRSHRLFNRRLVIKSVNLQEIDIIRFQTS